LEISSRETAAAWFNANKKLPRGYVSSRSLMRALPGIAASTESDLSILCLPVLRGILTSIVALQNQGEHYDHSINTARTSIYMSARRIDFSAHYTSAYGIARAVAKFTSGNFSEETTYDPLVKSAQIIRGFDATNEPNCYSTAWAVAGSDANMILAGTNIFGSPLWPDGILPKFFSDQYAKIVGFWNADLEVWGFWARWYEGMLNGTPMPWDLQEKVALIDQEVWEKGTQAVAEEIAKIEASFIAGTVKESIIETPLGKLTLVPQPFKETRHFGQLMDTLRDTLEFATADFRNGLSRECYQALMIERMLTRYANDPQRVEMDCERVKVSLMQDMAEDTIPTSAANRDLVQTLGDVAGSIRESDAEIAANRVRLNRIRLAEISPEDGACIAEVAVEVAAISEGVLQQDLLEDRFRLPGVQRGDGVPDPIVPLGGAERNEGLEAQAAQLRLSSRLAKTWLYLKEHSIEVGVLGSLASIIGLLITLVF